MSESSFGSYIWKSLIFAGVAAVAITNCIVYSNGTTSSNGSGSGDENIGITNNCALIMLILNIIIAIIAVLLFIVFMYWAFTSNKKVDVVYAPATVTTPCNPNVC